MVDLYIHSYTYMLAIVHITLETNQIKILKNIKLESSSYDKSNNKSF